jgi:hypothetical protein
MATRAKNLQGESHFSQKWHLANVGESGKSVQHGLASVGEPGESLQHGLANVGESGESSQKWIFFGEYSNSLNSRANGHCLFMMLQFDLIFFQHLELNGRMNGRGVNGRSTRYFKLSSDLVKLARTTNRLISLKSNSCREHSEQMQLVFQVS